MAAATLRAPFARAFPEAKLKEFILLVGSDLVDQGAIYRALRLVTLTSKERRPILCTQRDEANATVPDLAKPVRSCPNCIAKVVRSGRANFLNAAEGFDVFRRGGPRQLRLIHSAAFLFALRRRL
jgi:hypothetical protein